MRVVLVLAICFRVFALQFADGVVPLVVPIAAWAGETIGGYVVYSVLDEIKGSFENPDPLNIVKSFVEINGKLQKIEREVR